jgi:signal transduction histidine kinase
MALSIEDFLNVSRIEQGRMKYENTNVDVRDMAQKVTEEMQQAALKKGLVLLFHSEAKGSTVAHVDPGKTRQVIYNLVDNALKYTPKGSIDVVVRSEMGGKVVSIDIKDTGVGISKETAARLFDKFVRARNANSVNVSGTGLGLYVAKQMIEAMGGKITIASEGEGKGSTFTIELPLA